jgi:uncharacterized membrane protein YeaQ/YmgE (transglycosylase-associated protein family)
MNDLVELVIVGVVAGLIIGLFPGERGAGRMRNIVVGILGAIIGSFVYKQFLASMLKLNLPTFRLDLNQVAIALIGGVLLLLVLHFVQRKR